MPNTIALQVPGATHEEVIATGAFKPGNAINGAAVAAADYGRLVVAKEDALQGKTIADAYSIGDRAFLVIPQPGNVVQVRAKADTYANGAPLQILANGEIGDQAAGKPLVGHAEAVDADKGGAVNQVVAADGDFLRVRVA